MGVNDDAVPVPDRPLPPAPADEAPTEMGGHRAGRPPDAENGGAGFPGRAGWLFALIGIVVGGAILFYLRVAR